MACQDVGYLRDDSLQPGMPGFGKLQPCPDCDRRRQAAFHARRVAESNLNLREQNWNLGMVFASKPGRARGKAAALAVLETKGWLTLWGGYGSGKSFLGVATVNAGLSRGLSSVYWPMPLFLEELRKAFAPGAPEQSSAIYERALTAEVLVIDEFEKFQPTPWALERFQTLFLERYRTDAHAVTVWITNWEPTITAGTDHGLPEMDALFSRMRHHSIVHMDDGDLRPTLGDTRNEGVPGAGERAVRAGE